MSAPVAHIAEPIGALEPSKISCRNTAAHALTIVRDGVITGEGPTTQGRVHFSRALDADDVAWCARILTAAAVEHQPVSRAEAEALFEINDAAAAHGCIVAGNGDRKLGAGTSRRRRYRSPALDRQPDARQASQQPGFNGLG